MEDPQIIPKGILIALPLVIGTYVLPTLASVGAIGQWADWGSDGVSYVDVAREFAPVSALPLYVGGGDFQSGFV